MLCSLCSTCIYDVKCAPEPRYAAQESVYALETFLTARTRFVLWHAPLFTWTEFVHEEKLPLCTQCTLIADRNEQ
jgi:hypothetical protein